MLKINRIVIALLATASIAVYSSAASAQNAPAAQGDASIDKNLSKNPDNKGLQNADTKVEANEAKAAEKRADHKEGKKEAKKGTHKGAHSEHQMKAEHPAKPERPGR